jgi:hypothetical protein
MKRVLAILLLLGWGVLWAPAALAVLDPPGGGAAGTSTPSAAGGAAIKPAPSVCVALPVLNAGGKCISNDPAKGGAIIVYLKQILTLLSGLVGAVIVLMLIVAGVQYIVAFGDPGQIKTAKGRIVNALTALVLFLMMFAILQFLVPGGVIS